MLVHEVPSLYYRSYHSTETVLLKVLNDLLLSAQIGILVPIEPQRRTNGMSGTGSSIKNLKAIPSKTKNVGVFLACNYVSLRSLRRGYDSIFLYFYFPVDAVQPSKNVGVKCSCGVNPREIDQCRARPNHRFS